MLSKADIANQEKKNTIPLMTQNVPKKWGNSSLRTISSKADAWTSTVTLTAIISKAQKHINLQRGKMG